MGTFLDQRSSMNANATGSINTLVNATPALFGVVGSSNTRGDEPHRQLSRNLRAILGNYRHDGATAGRSWRKSDSRSCYLLGDLHPRCSGTRR